MKLPSEIYAQYAFATKLGAAGRELPKVHLIAKNRLTQYMGPASHSPPRTVWFCPLWLTTRRAALASALTGYLSDKGVVLGAPVDDHLVPIHR